MIRYYNTRNYSCKIDSDTPTKLVLFYDDDDLEIVIDL